MRPAREAIQPNPGASFFWFRRREASFPFAWHCHPEIELTRIVAGRGRRFVGDSVEAYRPGELVLLGPDLPHTWQSEGPGPHAAVVVQFRPDFLGAGFFASPELGPVRALLERARRGLRFAAGDAEAVAETLDALPERGPPDALLALLGILHRLARGAGATPLAAPGHAEPAPAAEAARLGRVLALLQARFPAMPSQREAAAEIPMNPASFARFFGRAMGRTYSAYCNELRVSEACRRLSETREPLAGIAEACGFASQAAFSRAFRRLKGMSPRAYRRAFPSPG